MPFARLATTVRRAAAGSLFLTLTLACWGQEPSTAPTPQNTPEARPVPVLNYAKPVSHFPNPIGPYTARHLGPPNLANTARIDQLMHDGKLYLSLNDAIALALENNLDIAIARYNLNIADTDVLRARAGASILGVPLGIVQNTPGGGVGGIGGQVGSGTGGTTLAAGGAEAAGAPAARARPRLKAQAQDASPCPCSQEKAASRCAAGIWRHGASSAPASRSRPSKGSWRR